ncbi:hypothetical protein AVEN_87579-1 [Araneus ventricosus]|uniref:Uncharacterized protein n=1 Tax=Araneus ventricosus TaxID=182803 RepID=A0A4Y2U4M7_ARAVE|nr:hypothetical protein AVEN_87579-1 [Araneus ventricosus]
MKSDAAGDMRWRDLWTKKSSDNVEAVKEMQMRPEFMTFCDKYRVKSCPGGRCMIENDVTERQSGGKVMDTYKRGDTMRGLNRNIIMIYRE